MITIEDIINEYNEFMNEYKKNPKDFDADPIPEKVLQRTLELGYRLKGFPECSGIECSIDGSLTFRWDFWKDRYSLMLCVYKDCYILLFDFPYFSKMPKTTRVTNIDKLLSCLKYYFDTKKTVEDLIKFEIGKLEEVWENYCEHEEMKNLYSI